MLKRSSILRRIAVAALAFAAVSPALPASATSVPSAPQDMIVISGRYRFLVMWDAPASVGGSAITGYTVTVTPTGGGSAYTCTTNGSGRRCLIQSLPTTQTQYAISVRATNLQGTSTGNPSLNYTTYSMPTGPSTTSLAGKDFSNLNLTSMNFTGADLTNANFTGSQLTSAYFREVDVTGANFVNTTLTDLISRQVVGNPGATRPGYQNISGFIVGPRVNLWGQNLSGLNFASANLWYAQLSNANLSSANLSNTNMTGALLQNTNMTGSTIFRTNLRSSIMNGANVAGLNLSTAYFGASMRGLTMDHAGATVPSGYTFVNSNLVGPNMVLFNADLSGQNLAGINFSNSNFWQANLSGANLTNANLSGADMRANLTGATGSGIIGNPNKITPGFRVQGGALQND